MQGRTMTEFAATMERWNNFFTLTAGVSATLIGLLFVALALNPAIMSESSGSPGLRIWAGQTFHNFLMVLLIAMVAVMPDHDASSVLWTLLVVGGTGVLSLAQAVRGTRTDPDPAWRLRNAILRFLSPIIGYAAALWAAYLATQNNTAAIGWMTTAVFFLLMSAAGNCWDLLKAIGDPRITRPPA